MRSNSFAAGLKSLQLPRFEYDGFNHDDDSVMIGCKRSNLLIIQCRVSNNSLKIRSDGRILQMMNDFGCFI